MIDNRIIIDGKMYKMIEQSYIILNGQLFLSIDYQDKDGKFYSKKFFIGKEDEILNI